MCSGVLPENTVCDHNWPCNPQKQFKDVSHKEGMCEHDTEMPPSSLKQSSFEMNWGSMENCSVIKQTETGNSFWGHSWLTGTADCLTSCSKSVSFRHHVLTFWFGTAFLVHNPNLLTKVKTIYKLRKLRCCVTLIKKDAVICEFHKPNISWF